MSTIAKLAAALATADDKAKAVVPKSGWMSRKLWIFAGIALGMIWLGRGNLTQILDGLIWLTAIYLVSQTLHDIATDFCNAWVQRNKDRAAADVQVAAYTSKLDPLALPGATAAKAP